MKNFYQEHFCFNEYITENVPKDLDQDAEETKQKS